MLPERAAVPPVYPTSILYSSDAGLACVPVLHHDWGSLNQARDDSGRERSGEAAAALELPPRTTDDEACRGLTVVLFVRLRSMRPSRGGLNNNGGSTGNDRKNCFRRRETFKLQAIAKPSRIRF